MSKGSSSPIIKKNVSALCQKKPKNGENQLITYLQEKDSPPPTRIDASSNFESCCEKLQQKESERRQYAGIIANWTVDDVVKWACSLKCLSHEVIICLKNEKIDGGVLLLLCEDDVRNMRYKLDYKLPFGDLKKLWLLIHNLQEHHQRLNAKHTFLFGTESLDDFATTDNFDTSSTPIHRRRQQHQRHEITTTQQSATTTTYCHQQQQENNLDVAGINGGGGIGAGCFYQNTDFISNLPNIGDNVDVWTTDMIEGRAVNIPPEFFKTFISLGYSFLVTWITSFVMVIVHERVPDMKRYPPLPDIFLDNVPHIPWAFHMCEITGTLLFVIWSCVCIFHKYRMVLLRRFFALAGTVFLLRCVTMLITSLSVPGTHLQCDQSDYAVDDTNLTLTEALELRISRAYTIWSGLGMSIQGVRTCGDYMFSGHTVALTLLNFFITEYTPRNLYFLHTLTWLLNMFGIFFILAAHEHYSIDVFVAFYITSRLFLYYHTLANNQALKSRDSTRTRIWFPMFSYFESSVDGIIPNEFDTVSTLLDGLFRILLEIKDACMMTAQRLSVDPPYFAAATKNLFIYPVATKTAAKQHRNVATSTHSAVMMASASAVGAAATGSGTNSFQSPTTSMSSVESLQVNDNKVNTVCQNRTSTTSTTKTTVVPDQQPQKQEQLYEIANGNASGDVTFKKSKGTITNIALTNHNNNNNNNSLNLTTATDLAADEEQTKLAASKDFKASAATINTKKQN